ncbi:MAG TPA: hypothetical protein PLT64_04585 [Syntrophales bacterium]|nr:hypothetical protein [Syntrophales bacterium]HOL59129.1 hypothetical protein [Syntrophales bacterium]HPO36074.1 hypothetical protein [Syntrophales bacterium]
MGVAKDRHCHIFPTGYDEKSIAERLTIERNIVLIFPQARVRAPGAP